MIELVVFDLAGTLVDEGGAVLDAYRSALRAEGIAFTEADIQASRGGNKRHILQGFAERTLGKGTAADTAAARAYDRFDDELQIAYRGGSLAPLPGAEACLSALRHAQIAIASNTGFARSLADVILNRLGWAGPPFSAHVASDEVPEGRPAPYMIQLAMQRTGVLDVARVVVVGDTPRDLQAGVNAGAGGVVGVLSGSHGVDSLGRVRHTHLLEGVGTLPALLRDEFGCRVLDG